MGKISFLLGAATGYVLGARAGTERYEQIKTRAMQTWKSEPVQSKVEQAGDVAKNKVAPLAAEKAGDAASAVTDKVKSATGREDLPETIHRGDDGTLHADTSGFGPGGDKLP